MLPVRIYTSELRVITEEIVSNPNPETGGQLLGLWTHSGAPVIFLATRPGPGALKKETHFQQNPIVHQKVERLVWEQFGLQNIGIWHSHHNLSLTQLSSGDILRTQNYAGRHRRPKFTEVLGWIREDGVHLRPHAYRNAATQKAEESEFKVLEGSSPIRKQLRGLDPDIQDTLRGTLKRPAFHLHTHPPDERELKQSRQILESLERLIIRHVPSEMRAQIRLEEVNSQHFNFLLHWGDRKFGAEFTWRGQAKLLKAWTTDGKEKTRLSGTNIARTIQQGIQILQAAD